ncbi:GntR family transcriptional regulator [Scatolibacter rhodanostii]|uniref:GntR family transcriptional regulator n=1 Tax=Scatolibacter rhodanostii TaxID=2014781 RepID=UPI000C079437|nr:GntR family transcriptional regulator [Scatolibacter rhodanostii]
MKLDTESTKPIFQQISDEIEDAVFTGAFKEETQVPSTTEISAMFKINPATVLKGMNQLVDTGILYKKRGLGMFVAKGAAEKVRQNRQNNFLETYVKPMIEEAEKLNLSKDEIVGLVERGYKYE